MSSNGKNALSAVSKVIVGNGGYVILGFVANMFSANGLSPAAFGVVAVSLAILNVLQEICGNGLDMAMVRLASPHVKQNPEAASLYFKTTIKYKLSINIIVALILWFSAPWIAIYFFNDSTMEAMLKWVSAGLIGSAIYNFALSKMQAEERFGQYAVLRIVNNILKLLLLSCFWLLDIFTQESVLASWIIAFFIGYAMTFMFKHSTTRPSDTNLEPNKIPSPSKCFSDIFHFSKWLIGSSFLFCLYSRTDLIILGRYAEAAQIGQYAAAWNITFIIDLMTYSVIVALLPKATTLVCRSDFAAYMKQTFLICLGLCAMLLPLYFMANFLFTWFFPEYTESPDLFRILLSGALISLLFHPLYLILYTRNKVHKLTLVNFILVIFSIVSGLSLIPTYGAEGAAWITVSGRVIASALILYFAIRELNSDLHENADS